jgi:hypothetical protein
MLTIDEREVAVLAPARSPPRRILLSPDPRPRPLARESSQTLAVAARICGMTDGVLRLVHMRTCDPPLRGPARFFQKTVTEAAAVLEEALLRVWAAGGPRATTGVVTLALLHGTGDRPGDRRALRRPSLPPRQWTAAGRHGAGRIVRRIAHRAAIVKPVLCRV